MLMTGASGPSRRKASRGCAVPAGRNPPGRPVQDVTAADGQLIRTLTPELVDKTRTSSARPEITARPNPAGIADTPSDPTRSCPALSLAAAGAAWRPVAVGA